MAGDLDVIKNYSDFNNYKNKLYISYLYRLIRTQLVHVSSE